MATRLGCRTYRHGMPADTGTAGHRVFISYRREDSTAVQTLARALEARGLSVWLDQLELEQGEPFGEQIRNVVETTDTFVAVLSEAGLLRSAEWAEVATALDRRGIDVVPVALPPADIRSLAGRQVIEYTGAAAAQQLADRIQLGTTIDLTALSPARFEALVTDLLQRYGYALTPVSALSDAGYDLRAVRSGSAGAQGSDEFLVEVKAYRSSRVSVSEIQRLADIVRRHGAVRGLLVTNSQLTSVARQSLARTNEAGTPLQVMEGPTLRQMLVDNPDIARRYSTAGEPGAPQ